MRFSDIPGHIEVKRWLRQLVDNDKIPHALLLEGPEGIGKLAMARALIQYIYCEHPTDDGDSCGQCQSCTLLSSLNHLDSMYSFPVVKEDDNPISDKYLQQWKRFLSEEPLYAGIDRWTAMFSKTNARPVIYVTEANDLIHKLSFQARQSRYKSVIVWLPERLNEEAANKLLKLLEEPPQDTVFIMVCEEPEKLIDTIRSRAQRIDVKRIDIDAMANALVSSRGIDEDTAYRIARAANGSWLNALEELDADNEKRQFLEMFISLMRLAYMRKIKDLKKWSDTVAGYGRERQKRMLAYFLRLVRENFMYNFRIPQLNYMTREEENFSRNFSPYINEANVIEISGLMNRAIRDIGQNANAKIVFFDMTTNIIVALLRKP